MVEYGIKEYRIFDKFIFNEIAQYFLIICSIIFSRDTLISTSELSFNLTLIIQVTVMAFTTMTLIIRNHKNVLIRENTFAAFIAFCSIIVVSSLLKLDLQMYIISVLFYLCSAFLFVHIFTFDSFFKKFSNVMLFLSVFSLIVCYCLRSFLFLNGKVNSSLPIITNSVGTPFIDFGLSYVVALPYYLRNFGIFREPGVYQFFLLIPLLYELLLSKTKHPRWIYVFIFAITIFSTFSAPGIVVMFMIFIVYIIKLMLESKMTKKIAIIITISLAAMTLIFTVLYTVKPDFRSSINEIIKKVTTMNDSSGGRLNSLIVSIKLFFYSPLLGNHFSAVVSQNGACINSTFSMMAIWGIFAGALFTWSQYLFAKLVSNNKIIKIFMLIILIVMVNTQFLLGNMVFWIFVFTPFMMRDNEQDESNQWSLKKCLTTCFNWIKDRIKFQKA